ncbi:16S rRNA (cytidine(1402)-2'-O)-methyltransferase [Williamsoniiplasma lucivorax]|uniref:16S rRNA (Cytidine1402-2'-O)-methyltransferase n=1 Tax=Williamsoniiplasma lucivorax TaxID=209274 RepID=A0A2S5REN9_9MOLU|nr:16S rRNA (cytidine(1402)-2'-O)-methyltransferase [Williamsoniiplasma lucivorax]PPE05781.1 16S rRNA (cytidine1402-2'-O)-methyltransferase [Williamsoniiplasma lucivorax]
MLNQNTFKNNYPTIFLVGTPIGNLDDFSLRGVETLQAVDVIFCEDTRVSKVLLQKYNISKPLVSLNKVNETQKIAQLVQYLQDNKNVAIISDAGVPIISDPGAIVINQIRKLNLPVNVTAINAGPAYIHAIAISGYTNISNLFYGFIKNKNEQTKTIELTQVISKFNQEHILAFYESVHRIRETMQVLQAIDAQANVLVARELTKINEQIIQGTVAEVNQVIQSEDFILKGEFVVVLDAKPTTNSSMTDQQIFIEVEKYLAQGYKLKQASAIVSDLFDLNKNEIYNKYLKMNKNL